MCYDEIKMNEYSYCIMNIHIVWWQGVHLVEPLSLMESKNSVRQVKTLSNVTSGKSKRYQMSRQASQNVTKCHVRQVKTLSNVTSGKSKRYQMSRQASQNVTKCHVRQVKTLSNVTSGKSKCYQMSR